MSESSQQSDDILKGLVLVRRSGPLRRPEKPLPTLNVERELDSSDIERINSGERPVEESSSREIVQKLRWKHHQAARALAEGMSVQQAAISAGYDVQTIHLLKRDPAFQELVAHYGRQVQETFALAQERIAGLGMTAIDVLQERLDDPEGYIPTDEVRKIAEMALERSIAPSKGTAKVSEQPNGKGLTVNLNFTEPPKEKTPIVVIDVEANEGERG